MSERQTYEQQVDSQLAQLSGEMQGLETKLGSVEDKTKKSVLEAVLATLRQKKLILESRIQNLREAEETDWNDLKPTVDDALAEMKTAVKSAAEKFGP